VVVGILLVQAIWNLVAATWLVFWAARAQERTALPRAARITC
jgi:hypothetical protein